jgi:hypothetical protein
VKSFKLRLAAWLRADDVSSTACSCILLALQLLLLLLLLLLQIAQLEDRLRAAESAAAAAAATPNAPGGGGAAAAAAAAAADEQLAQLQQQLAASRTQVGVLTALRAMEQSGGKICILDHGSVGFSALHCIACRYMSVHTVHVFTCSNHAKAVKR